MLSSYVPRIGDTFRQQLLPTSPYLGHLANYVGDKSAYLGNRSAQTASRLWNGATSFMRNKSTRSPRLTDSTMPSDEQVLPNVTWGDIGNTASNAARRTAKSAASMLDTTAHLAKRTADTGAVVGDAALTMVGDAAQTSKNIFQPVKTLTKEGASVVKSVLENSSAFAEESLSTFRNASSAILAGIDGISTKYRIQKGNEKLNLSDMQQRNLKSQLEEHYINDLNKLYRAQSAYIKQKNDNIKKFLDVRCPISWTGKIQCKNEPIFKLIDAFRKQLNLTNVDGDISLSNLDSLKTTIPFLLFKTQSNDPDIIRQVFATTSENATTNFEEIKKKFEKLERELRNAFDTKLADEIIPAAESGQEIPFSTQYSTSLPDQQQGEEDEEVNKKLLNVENGGTKKKKQKKKKTRVKSHKKQNKKKTKRR